MNKIVKKSQADLTSIQSSHDRDRENHKSQLEACRQTIALAQTNRQEEVQSKLQETTAQIDKQESSIKFLAKSFEELRCSVDAKTGALQSSISTYKARQTGLRPSSQSRKPEDASTDTTDRDTPVREIVEAQVNKANLNLQTQLSHIVNRLGSFIDSERKKRLTIQERLSEASQITETMTKLEAALKDQVIDGARQSRDIDIINNQIRLCIEGQGTIKDMIQTRFEDVKLQLLGLHNWQSNFNSKYLFREICGYIDNTMSKSFKHAISQLDGRLKAVEEEVLPAKRRKVAYGSAAPQSSRPVD